MFDPDSLKETLRLKLEKEAVSQPTYRPHNPAPREPYSPPSNIMSEKDRLRFYLKECSGTRAYYGFGMSKDRKLVIEDIKRIERFDAITKAILRELYLELK